MIADVEISKFNFRKPTNVDQANYWGLVLIPTSFNKEPLSGYVEQVPTLDVDCRLSQTIGASSCAN
jgi:hypothetical protein